MNTPPKPGRVLHVERRPVRSALTSVHTRVYAGVACGVSPHGDHHPRGSA
jgi:hypothetical protein